MTFIRTEFDSLTALVAAARKPIAGKVDLSRNLKWTDTAGATYEQALELVTAGWPVGREAWANAATADFSQFASPAPTVTYDVAGAFPDIPRAVAGDPACFADRGADDCARPVITVMVNIVSSAGVSVDVIRNRGLAILTAIDNAEARGIRVEIIGAYAAHSLGRGATDLITWPLKSADSPVDLDRLTFALAHPSMGRRLLFAVREGDPRYAAIGLTSTHGTPDEVPQQYRPTRCAYFGRLMYGSPDLQACATPAGAMAYVNAAIARATTEQQD